MEILSRLRRITRKVPDGFRFSRPLVLIQSDDWGRVGVRDQEGWSALRAAGINLGERPYDFYSLETAEDVRALTNTLLNLRDSVGQPARVMMNFIVANPKFANVQITDENSWLPLADGLPGRWLRPQLFEAYREGIAAGVFCPALHGATHLCIRCADRALRMGGERSNLLRAFWAEETPYIHWRMPWVGFEYWDPEETAARRFLLSNEQDERIRWAIKAYTKFFGAGPTSACAPGYRADQSTHQHWWECGIRIAQSGPGITRAPHFDDRGLLHTYRSIDFEPALQPQLDWQDCVKQAREWLSHGLPFVLSMHSINFHSTLAGFRQKTLPMLNKLLKALVREFPNLLFVSDEQLLKIIESGFYEGQTGKINVAVSRAGGQE